MRALIVYYSRTGKTRKAAEMLAERLNAKTEEIRDNRDRSGFLGFLRSAKEAIRKETVEIQPLKHDIENFNLIIIASPIWAGTIASPVRSFIEKNKSKLYRAGFFCTMGGSDNEDKAAKEVERLLGRKLKVKAAFSREDLKPGCISPRVEYFIASVFILPDYN